MFAFFQVITASLCLGGGGTEEPHHHQAASSFTTKSPLVELPTDSPWAGSALLGAGREGWGTWSPWSTCSRTCDSGKNGV